jgi:hypothetical protein
MPHQALTSFRRVARIALHHAPAGVFDRAVLKELELGSCAAIKDGSAGRPSAAA